MPRVDGDPVFHALLGAQRERRRRVRDRDRRLRPQRAGLCRQHRGAAHAAVGLARPRHRDHRLRAALPVQGPHVPPADAGAAHPRAGRRAAHPHPRCNPRFDWGQAAPRLTQGSHHIRYVGPDQVLRLTTSIPLAYVLQDQAFVVTEPVSADPRARRVARHGRRTTWRERFERETAAVLAHLGAPAGAAAAVAGRGDPRRDHAQALRVRGHRRHRRGADDQHPRGARHRSATGTTATAGCATPSSSCARSTAWARSARWRTTCAG